MSETQRVRFIGQGTYVGYFDGDLQGKGYGPGHVLEVSAATAKELLERRQGDAPEWEAAGKAALGAPAPKESTQSTPAAPAPAKP